MIYQRKTFKGALKMYLISELNSNLLFHHELLILRLLRDVVCTKFQNKPKQCRNHRHLCIFVDEIMGRMSALFSKSHVGEYFFLHRFILSLVLHTRVIFTCIGSVPPSAYLFSLSPHFPSDLPQWDWQKTDRESLFLQFISPGHLPSWGCTLVCKAKHTDGWTVIQCLW